MKTQILTSIIILFFGYSLSINSPIVNQDQLPDAPKGYTWQTLKEVQAYALLPDHWFLHAEQKGNTYAYFITKEDYTKDPNGMFVTGFSLNVFTNMGNNNAVEYAYSFAEQMKKGNEVLSFEDYKVDNFQGKKLRIKNEGQIIQYLVFGNLKTNKMYLAYFESSIPTWDKNEDFSKTIMNNLALNPDF